MREEIDGAKDEYKWIRAPSLGGDSFLGYGFKGFSNIVGSLGRGLEVAGNGILFSPLIDLLSCYLMIKSGFTLRL